LRVGIVWAVPVVAAAVGGAIVAACARPFEDASTALAAEVARLRELRRPLASLRASAAETDARVEAFRRRHAPPNGDDAGERPNLTLVERSDHSGH
jgi:hypothetical protein